MSNTPLRVLIIGGGAAGMSAACAFNSQHSERFDVTGCYFVRAFFKTSSTSLSTDKNEYGADYINDGVQGATPVYHNLNAYAMFERLSPGFAPSDVGIQMWGSKSVLETMQKPTFGAMSS